MRTSIFVIATMAFVVCVSTGSSVGVLSIRGDLPLVMASPRDCEFGLPSRLLMWTHPNTSDGDRPSDPLGKSALTFDVRHDLLNGTLFLGKPPPSEFNSGAI